MAEITGISWCDHTFNPWIGCTKISPACDQCYAETWDNRFGGGHWGASAPRRRTTPQNWSKVRKWNRQAVADRVRRRVFVASLADVFDNAVDPAWRADLWELIRDCPGLDFLLLTKRPMNIAQMLPPDWGDGWPNVWLGTTAENQTEANRRIPHLLAAPAAVRFLSCEPLLGPLDLSSVPAIGRSGWLCPLTGGHQLQPVHADHSGSKIDWVICGGESGPGARPMHPHWARSLRDQCEGAGVPFFFKQWGEWKPHTPTAGGDLGADVRHGRVRIVHPSGRTGVEVFEATGGRSTEQGSRYMSCVGKKAAGDLLDGVQHHAWPELEHA